MFGVGVDGRGRGAEGDADDPAEQSEQDSFGEELGADVAFGGAEYGDGFLGAGRAETAQGRRRPMGLLSFSGTSRFGMGRVAHDGRS